jgi:hypothetical protein
VSEIQPDKVVSLKGITIKIDNSAMTILVEHLARTAFAEVQRLADHLQPQIENAQFVVRGDVHVFIDVNPAAVAVFEKLKLFKLEIRTSSGLADKLDLVVPA